MTAKEAKAHAKAAKAYAKAQRPLWKKKRFLLPVGVVALIVIIVAANGGSGGDKTTPAASSGTDVSKGIGSRDASADVKVVRLEPADAIGVRRPVLEITNNSSKRSNYLIELSLESADGKTQYDTTMATASNVETGQTTGGNVVGFLKSKTAPADAVVKIKSVSRTAA